MIGCQRRILLQLQDKEKNKSVGLQGGLMVNGIEVATKKAKSKKLKNRSVRAV